MMQRIRRRLRYWIGGMGQQCHKYYEKPSPIQIRGEWKVGFFTTYCQKSRGHFGGHTV